MTNNQSALFEPSDFSFPRWGLAISNYISCFISDNGNLINHVVSPYYLSFTNSFLGTLNTAYSPWGGNPLKAPDYEAYDSCLRDPGLRTANFPVNQPLDLSWLGRVHRGTPWQTFYLKSGSANIPRWLTNYELIPSQLLLRVRPDIVAGLEPTGTNHAFKLSVYPGHTYQLQESMDLKNWSTITNCTASEDTLHVPLSIPNSNSSRLYRVLLE
jgi:hypothetical protein